MDDYESSDLLTVEERFFLHIARKNGLLTQAQADEALALCREDEVPLEEAFRALQLLDEGQIRRVREAMAASQVVRLDAVYADIALSRGLVSRPALEAAFAEQKRQRYRTRLGNLLVERGHLKADLHRTIITEVIRRLKSEGPQAYGSTVERRGEAAAESALFRGGDGPTLPPARPVIPLDGSDEVVAPASQRRDLLLSANEASGPPDPPAKGWSPTAGTGSSWSPKRPEPPRGGPAGGAALALDASEASDDPLVTSAIRMGLSSAEHAIPLHTADADRSNADLFEASGEANPTGSFVLDREALAPSTSGEPAAASPAAKKALLAAAVVAVGLAVAVAAALGTVVASNRRALSRARDLAAQAEDEPQPAAKATLWRQASEALAGAGGLGTSSAEAARLADRVRWGELEAEALGLIASGKGADAKQLLERRKAEVAPAHEAAWAKLLKDAGRGDALREGRDAEARGDFAAAVAAYRDARDRGDPGNVALGRLQAIRAALGKRLEEKQARALQTLDEADEQALAAEAKLITELFNEDPGTTERLEELRYRRALRRGLEALGQDQLEVAQAQLETARRLRPRDAEAAAALDRLARRRELDAARRRAREAEAQRRFEEAAEQWRRAAELAESDRERATLEASAQKAAGEAGDAKEREERRRRGQEAVKLLRESKVQEARAILEELAKGGQAGATTQKLLELAKRVEGMVYVPAGPFVMGTAPGPNARAHEQPQRTVELPAYFIDRTEVTNAAYARCVAEGKVPAPSHWDRPQPQKDGSVRKTYEPVIAEHPVVHVTWAQAGAYAAWRGGRLPSEEQWEKAARGTDGRTFPWGEGTSVRVHVSASPGRTHPTSAVAAHVSDKSPFGCMDMAGNVGEWTSDPFGPYPGAPADLKLPAGRKTIRGGAYRWGFDDARCAARDGGAETDSWPNVGFRVVVEVPADLTPLR